MGTKTPGEALSVEEKTLKELASALEALDGMNLIQLREQHVQLFGEPARSKNLPYLRKRLAFRMQERIEGGLSPLAEARIRELAPGELPVKIPRVIRHAKPASSLTPFRDARLPDVGTVLVREHAGLTHEIEVLESGFRYSGRRYGSLSAIAKEITGTAWNGFLFFGLTAKQVKHGC